MTGKSMRHHKHQKTFYPLGWRWLLGLAAALALAGVMSGRLMGKNQSATLQVPTVQPSDAQGPHGPFAPRSDQHTQTSPPPIPKPTTLPEAVQLSVPFAEQAPHRVWDHDHEELCEEAASLMVGRYFSGQSVGTADDVDTALFALKDWEIQHLAGTWENTTAAQTAMMIRDVYGLTVTLATDPSVNDLKRALADGNLVITPTAGRKLGNPNFTPPGPLYHMLVVTGYTREGQFVTNDPGIWQGKGWAYSTDVLMNALGDWNGGDPEHGAKIVLLVTKCLRD